MAIKPCVPRYLHYIKALIDKFDNQSRNIHKQHRQVIYRCNKMTSWLTWIYLYALWGVLLPFPVFIGVIIMSKYILLRLQNCENIWRVSCKPPKLWACVMKGDLWDIYVVTYIAFLLCVKTADHQNITTYLPLI